MNNNFGQEILNYVNAVVHDNKEVATTIANGHRYLQGEVFYMLVEILKELANNYKDGRVDDRNNYICFMAKEMLATYEDKQTIEKYKQNNFR